jgi:hypothetical protein
MNSHKELLNNKRAEKMAEENKAFHQLIDLLEDKLTGDEKKLFISLWVNGTLASEWVGWYDRAIIDEGYDRAEKVVN